MTATVLDTKLRPKVVALLAKYGKDVTFTAKPGSYSHTTGAASAGASLGTVRCTPPAGYAQRYVDGDVIRQGDVQLYLAGQGLTFTPEPGQRVTFDSTTYTVVAARPIYSGDLVAAWEVQARRG